MPELQMIQIVIAQWVSPNGRQSYSTLGLSRDGKVYRYDVECDGWLPNSMKEATCILEHKKRALKYKQDPPTPPKKFSEPVRPFTTKLFRAE